MRNILLALLFVLALLPAAAQDRIYAKRGGQQIIEAQVTEIDIEFIKYRRSSNLNGPVYKYPKKYVDSIVYANGSADYFSAGRVPRPVSPQKAIRQREYEKMGSNTFIAAAGIFDLANLSLGGQERSNMKNRPSAVFQLSYERTVLNNRLGLEVTPFVGLNDGAYGFGFATRFYPKNRGRVRIGMGPQYVLASKEVINRYLVSNPDMNNPFRSAADVFAKEKALFSAIAFTGKVTINLNKTWCIAGNTALGGTMSARVSDDNHPDDWDLRPYNFYYSAAVGVGLRF